MLRRGDVVSNSDVCAKQLRKRSYDCAVRKIPVQTRYEHLKCSDYLHKIELPLLEILLTLFNSCYYRHSHSFSAFFSDMCTVY